MIKRIIILSFVHCLMVFSTLSAQVSNVSVDHDIYTFLSKMSQKGIIQFDELVKPLSRRYIAESLIKVKQKISKLTSLQKKELKFYEQEFGFEIELEERIKTKDKSKREKSDVLESGAQDSESGIQDIEKSGGQRDLTDKNWEFDVRKGTANNENAANENFTFVKKDKYQRWRFFNFSNHIFNVNVNPVLGYGIGNWEGESYKKLTLGIKFHGEIGNVLGYNFEVKNIREAPPISNFLYNRFAKKTSINIQLADSDRREYSFLNVDMGGSWEWGSFTIGKNHINWGYAESGKLILSSRAPSFPYIRLDITPTDWFSFNYIHAWLNSDVIDTAASHSSWRVRLENTDKISYVGKYLALHSATFRFWNGLEFSFGESAVYSGNLQMIYLIPIMFFDLADEYLNRNDNYAGASTQLFLALSSKNHVPNTHLYASFHSDELTPEGLFDPEIQYYKFGFTFGGYVIDMPIDNLGLRLEYTKIYPGNYRHFIPSLTYESSSSLMGHWIGDNGDLLYAALDYTIIRGLKIKVWSQFIRKGTEAMGNRAYKVQIPQPGFLFTDNIGDRKNYNYFGINVEYELLHDIWFRANYQNIDYQQQYEEGKFNSTKNENVSFSFGYGI